ncbi:MAG: UDP-2,3-diacylglucosamine diphosphatase [Gammaproteobacteria bacterium]
MTVAFISDLHLCADRPHKVTLFERLLAHLAGRCQALYVLGDLFEYWVGDDDDTPPNPGVVAAIAILVQAGTAVGVLHGNRDFLLGEGFARATGATLLAETAVVELHGVPTLLMHGDLLCTRDLPYQQLRRTVQNPQWKAAALARPLAERRAIAAQMRDGSVEAKLAKAEEIMDVEPAAVGEALDRHGVRHLIHGHTHRPAVHEFQHGAQRARRTVLGDWYALDSVLVCEPGDRQRLLRVEDYLAR